MDRPFFGPGIEAGHGNALDVEDNRLTHRSVSRTKVVNRDNSNLLQIVRSSDKWPSSEKPLTPVSH